MKYLSYHMKNGIAILAIFIMFVIPALSFCIWQLFVPTSHSKEVSVDTNEVSVDAKEVSVDTNYEQLKYVWELRDCDTAIILRGERASKIVTCYYREK